MADMMDYGGGDLSREAAGQRRPMQPRRTRAQQIEAAKLKLQRLTAAEAKARRSGETRRKVMVGVAAEIEMERDPEFRARMVEIMRRHLTKPLDLKAVADWLTTTTTRA